MSRSKPSTQGTSPCTRYFKIGSGDGNVTYYDKQQEKTVTVGPRFQFLLLDELASVGGWHEPSQSGIYSNEVRDTRNEVLRVRTFAGQSLASGKYQDIREKIAVAGGKYVASCYIAYKDDAGKLALGNIQFKGSSLSHWMDFKKECRTVEVDGKRVKAYFADAIRIDGFKKAKKGSTNYFTPIFATVPVPEEVNEMANALDAQLQEYLGEYLARPVAAQADDTEETTQE